MKAILNVLKQFTSRGCKVWDVWIGNVIISNPISYTYPIAFNVTCELCQSKVEDAY
jgi:hypothetical protein